MQALSAYARGTRGREASSTRPKHTKNLPVEEPRQIPLYRTPAAAGYASPVYGEDFDCPR